MDLLKVNGRAVPCPSEMKVDLFDVSASADRSAAGTIVLDRVATKRKLELVWYFMSAADLRELLSLTGDEVFFTVLYPDPRTGAAREMSCYCGDRSTGVLRVSAGAPLWTDIRMNWIEK